MSCRDAFLVRLMMIYLNYTQSSQNLRTIDEKCIDNIYIYIGIIIIHIKRDNYDNFNYISYCGSFNRHRSYRNRFR